MGKKDTTVQQQDDGNPGRAAAPTGGVEPSSDEDEDPIRPPPQRKVPANGKTETQKSTQTERILSQEPNPSEPVPTGQSPSGEYEPRDQQTHHPQQPPAQNQAQVLQPPIQNNHTSQATHGQTQREGPSSTQYMRMTVADMRDELHYRRVALPTNAEGRRVLKAEYKRKLRDADAAGTYGRGVNKKRK